MLRGKVKHLIRAQKLDEVIYTCSELRWGTSYVLEMHLAIKKWRHFEAIRHFQVWSAVHSACRCLGQSIISVGDIHVFQYTAENRSTSACTQSAVARCEEKPLWTVRILPVHQHQSDFSLLTVVSPNASSQAHVHKDMIAQPLRSVSVLSNLQSVMEAIYNHSLRRYTIPWSNNAPSLEAAMNLEFFWSIDGQKVFW